ncbi:MAG TPA: alpha/beta hydrolase domain-containing protein [Bryobacteraceae bacterium]|nr:alpha/beta hydrolase domain-containing protein [Bryobacteraceae bacterium]
MLRPFISYFLLIASACYAAVTHIDITERAQDGGYDQIAGKIYFAVDPKLAPNRIIADIDMAPRNAEGKVEFSADLYMLRPHDAAKRNGTALVEIPNRGNKGMLGTFNLGDNFLLDQGFTLVWVGWEFDLPSRPGVLRIDAPVASDHGKTITGLVRSEWVGNERVTTIPLGDRDEIGYSVADAKDPANKIFVRDTVEGPRRLIAGSDWTFSDSTHVTMSSGFEPGKIYEVIYLAKDPVLVGLGPTAVRDAVSYLKYNGVETPIDDFRKDIQRTLGFGVSQSGRFLRTFLYDGFNQDEKNRRVFDGVWANIGGAGRGGFNARFAQPSRDGNPFFNILYPVDIPPFSDDGGLLANAIRTNTVPKIFYTNGSYEYWGRDASLIHTTPDGKQDVPTARDTRIYFFPGSRHGTGSLPPRHLEAQNLDSTNDYSPSLRALLIAMQAWLKDGKQPPASVYPRIAKDELASVGAYAFPKIPGVSTPRTNRRAFRLDFSVEPPKLGAPFPTLVPQVNSDGNEISGIHMPEIQVPLASYTGWNLRSSKIGAPDQLYTQAGSWIPFPLNKADRENRKDPRASIEERYPSKNDYLEKITAAAAQLIQGGYLLDRDIPYLRNRAAREWDYVLTSTR